MKILTDLIQQLPYRPGQARQVVLFTQSMIAFLYQNDFDIIRAQFFLNSQSSLPGDADIPHAMEKPHRTIKRYFLAQDKIIAAVIK